MVATAFICIFENWHKIRRLALCWLTLDVFRGLIYIVLNSNSSAPRGEEGKAMKQKTFQKKRMDLFRVLAATGGPAMIHEASDSDGTLILISRLEPEWLLDRLRQVFVIGYSVLSIQLDRDDEGRFAATATLIATNADLRVPRGMLDDEIQMALDEILQPPEDPRGYVLWKSADERFISVFNPFPGHFYKQATAMMKLGYILIGGIQRIQRSHDKVSASATFACLV